MFVYQKAKIQLYFITKLYARLIFLFPQVLSRIISLLAPPSFHYASFLPFPWWDFCSRIR